MVQYQSTLDGTFSALSDPTRRSILERLAQGSASISELAESAGMSLTGVKKHVRVLEEAELVTTEKRGRTRYCRLGPKQLDDASHWIESYRRGWDERFDRLEEDPRTKEGRIEMTAAAKKGSQATAAEEELELRLEVVVVPVSDVDRAKAFYTERLGFNADVDRQVSEEMRVVQMTPPGSSCSVTIGTGLATMEPGSLKGLQLVVSDLRRARNVLASRGVDISEVQVFESGGPRPAREGDELDIAGFAFFGDPDGNGWAVQQMPAGR